jgi:hypothetical protein
MNVPSAAADFAPARVPRPAELTEIGWVPADEARRPLVPVQPRIPVQRGAALLASQPERLPRPTVRLGDHAVALPLAASHRLLQRREAEEGPVLVWTPRTDLRHAGGTAWALEIDAHPFSRPIAPDQADIQAALLHGERRLAEAPMAITSRMNVNPARRFRVELPTETASDEPHPSGLTLQALPAPVSEDSLLVTVDEGATWWLVRPGTEPGAGDRHAMDATRVFVDGPRLILAPLARAPDASRELLMAEPPSLDLRPLPFPAPVGAPWRCEVSDLQERKGELEALVMIHDPRLRRAPEQEAATSWAARLRWTGEAWRELGRIPLPGDARALRLSFGDDGDELLLSHEDRLLGRRPLAGS